MFTRVYASFNALSPTNINVISSERNCGMTVDRENPESTENQDGQAVFPVSPHFDHAFVTVDVETSNIISECEFLLSEKFERFIIRTSENSLLGPYKPTRVFGKNNLVEIASPDPGCRFNFGAGSSLVLSPAGPED